MSVMDEHTKSAWEALQRLRRFKIQSLRRTKDLGQQQDFREAARIAKKIVEVHSRITVSVLESLPEGHLAQIQGHLENILREFDGIINFDPTQGNSHEARTEIIHNLKSHYDRIFETQGYIAALAIISSKQLDDDRANLNKLIKEAGDSRQEIEQKSTKTLDDASNALNEAKEAMDAAKEAAGQHGVSRQAIYFEREARNHEIVSIIWMLAVFSVATLMLCIVFFPQWLDSQILDSNADIFFYISNRVIMYSVLTYLLLFCGKSYSSHRHNAIVNRHRHNALSTYRALVEATSNREHADIVLHHAASCIFSPQVSGYTGAKESAASTTVPYGVAKRNAEES